MKKVIYTIIIGVLLATGVQANQESEVNVERLTIKPDISIPIKPNTKNIMIYTIELYESSEGHGKVVILFDAISTDGEHHIERYAKILEGGHGYYYEFMSGPLKQLEVTGKIKRKSY